MLLYNLTNINVDSGLWKIVFCNSYRPVNLIRDGGINLQLSEKWKRGVQLNHQRFPVRAEFLRLADGQLGEGGGEGVIIEGRDRKMKRFVLMKRFDLLEKQHVATDAVGHAWTGDSVGQSPFIISITARFSIKTTL